MKHMINPLEFHKDSRQIYSGKHGCKLQDTYMKTERMLLIHGDIYRFMDNGSGN